MMIDVDESFSGLHDRALNPCLASYHEIQIIMKSRKIELFKMGRKSIMCLPVPRTLVYKRLKTYIIWT